MSDQPKVKDRWDKLQSMGSALTPLSVALVGILGSTYLSTKQVEDTRARFYVELLSKREDADSLLRKDMFNTYIQTFLKPESNDPSRKVLGLELLAANFHESLDLSPIFRNVFAEVTDLKGPGRNDLMDRLDRVAGEVKDKQILALTGAGGFKIDGYLEDIQALRTKGVPMQMIDRVIDLPPDENAAGPPVPAHISVWAMVVDQKSQEIRVRLEIQSGDGSATFADNVFWIGPFDFPMLDNTRLTSGQRCAIVLTKFDAETSAEVTLVIFPASRASLKDKPYVDEMLSNLTSKTSRTRAPWTR